MQTGWIVRAAERQPHTGRKGDSAQRDRKVKVKEGREEEILRQNGTGCMANVMGDGRCRLQERDADVGARTRVVVKLGVAKRHHHRYRVYYLWLMKKVIEFRVGNTGCPKSP